MGGSPGGGRTRPQSGGLEAALPAAAVALPGPAGVPAADAPRGILPPAGAAPRPPGGSPGGRWLSPSGAAASSQRLEAAVLELAGVSRRPRVVGAWEAGGVLRAPVGPCKPKGFQPETPGRRSVSGNIFCCVLLRLRFST